MLGVHGRAGGPVASPGVLSMPSAGTTITASSHMPAHRERQAVPKPLASPTVGSPVRPRPRVGGRWRGVSAVSGRPLCVGRRRGAEVTTSLPQLEETAAPGTGGSVAARWATCRPCYRALPAPAASASAPASSALRPRRAPAPSGAGGCTGWTGCDGRMDEVGWTNEVGWTQHWHPVCQGTQGLPAPRLAPSCLALLWLMGTFPCGWSPSRCVPSRDVSPPGWCAQLAGAGRGTHL